MKGNGFIGVGFVLQDTIGSIRRAGVDRFQGNFDVNCAEAIVILSVLCFVFC